MKVKTSLTSAIAIAAFLIMRPGTALSSALEILKAKGEITIGVKEDAPPFSFRDSDGELVGLEIDLARDLAQRLGMKLTLFPVSAASRLQFLQQEGIDLIIATMAVTEDRAREAVLIDPPYYASGPALLVANDSGIASIGDLGDKTLCTVKSAYVLDELSKKAPQNAMKQYRSVADAAYGLASGECAAFAEDSARLGALKATETERWLGHRIVLLDGTVHRWAIAVKQGAERQDLADVLSETVRDWHQTGKLIALEKQWFGTNSQKLLDLREATK